MKLSELIEQKMLERSKPKIKIGDYDLTPYIISTYGNIHIGNIIFDLTDLSKLAMSSILIDLEKYKYMGNRIKFNYAFDSGRRILQIDYCKD